MVMVTAPLMLGGRLMTWRRGMSEVEAHPDQPIRFPPAFNHDHVHTRHPPAPLRLDLPVRQHLPDEYVHVSSDLPARVVRC